MERSKAVLVGHVDAGFPLQQQRHDIDVSSDYSQHQRSPSDETRMTQHVTELTGKRRTRAQSGNDSLSLRVRSVNQLCTIGVVQQEAHTRRVTVHHLENNEGEIRQAV